MTLPTVMLAPLSTFGGDGMNRRCFLRALFQGAAYVPLAPVALMAAPRRRVIMQQSNNPWDRIRFEVALDG